MSELYVFDMWSHAVMCKVHMHVLSEMSGDSVTRNMIGVMIVMLRVCKGLSARLRFCD